MKKIVFLFALALVFYNSEAQNRFFTKDAKINFNSSTPVEDIVAESNQATTLIDIDNNDVAFSVLTTSFKFRRALMEEHFNENYIESPKFPKAKFSGKIITPVDWKIEKQVVADVKGNLTLHGVTREVTLKALITPGKGKIIASAEFKITPEQFEIPIPSAVRDKIAKEVTIKIEAVYSPYQQ
jgi:polyisoprenoid-binding protein YceI